ncbi:MAG: hypothetical protein KatS3mg038_3992 [Candidatus Kapaibacterium sp.]|nr:MAG: hypothetical protein KatS3mg038_3992 [Candidatus Kapabacteria bacterium]
MNFESKTGKKYDWKNTPPRTSKTSENSAKTIFPVSSAIYSTGKIEKLVHELLRSRFVGAPRGHRQPLHCPFTENHRNGDRHPSAWLNLKTGWVNCAVCGAHRPEEVLKRFGAENAHSNATTPPHEQTHVRNQNAAPGARTAPKVPTIEAALAAPVVTTTWRGLAPQTLQQYDVRQLPNGWKAMLYYETQVNHACTCEGSCSADAECSCCCKPPTVTNCVAVKYRLPSGQLRYVSAPGSTFTVPFGLQACDPQVGWFLVVAEGEVNAMSCWQSAGALFDCVSIGSQQPSATLLGNLRTLAKWYAQVVVWMDEEERARNIASAIGGHAHVVVSQATDGVKMDANEILQRRGEDAVAAVLYRAAGVGGSTQTPAQLLDVLLTRLNRRLRN